MGEVSWMMDHLELAALLCLMCVLETYNRISVLLAVDALRHRRGILTCDCDLYTVSGWNEYLLQIDTECWVKMFSKSLPKTPEMHECH